MLTFNCAQSHSLYCWVATLLYVVVSVFLFVLLFQKGWSLFFYVKLDLENDFNFFYHQGKGFVAVLVCQLSYR